MTTTTHMPVTVQDGREGGSWHASASSITMLSSMRVSDTFRQIIPRDFAREHLIISQGCECGAELLAVATTSDPAAIFNAGVILASPVRTMIADGEEIARIIDEAYQIGGYAQTEATSDAHSAVDVAEIDDIDTLLAAADRDLLTTQGKAPVVKLVDAILFEALSRKASDVHVQPLADRTVVRYRLDGVLHTVRQMKGAKRLADAIISRIKVMGRLDIAEKRVPQDGRATVNIGERAIDLRISVLPTSYGERAVLRLLDNASQLCDFGRLGMPLNVADAYLDRAGRANGMILLTGPTGSGKTTTLYSTLRRIGSPGLNIMTIEDPIEYELALPEEGLVVSQSQVNPRKGVTFATGLRHILRQDPDVVMVGEIRDVETARIAIQSSLTGHLVFSTLHTNDAASAVTRLIDLGVEPYLVSASLSAALAQRLVRKLHGSCGGSGCDTCFGTGFQGRTALFELLAVDEEIRAMISRGSALSEIRVHAQARGMKTLLEDGKRLVQLGVTHETEVLRVVHGAW